MRRPRGATSAPGAGAVDWVTGCCLLAHRACWDDLGGFDPGFFLYYEDVDFCRRAIAKHRGTLLIEGIGGVMVPLDDKHTVLDWMAALDIPLLLVGATSHLGVLETFADIDVSLDPFPHGGAISTAESLYMGVPVLNLRGHTPMGRVTTSILGASGLSSWIAESGDQYVRIATAAATASPAARAVARSLRARSALCVKTKAADTAVSATTLAKANAGGGATVVPPMEVPGGDTIAVCADPQGAIFALLQVGDQRGRCLIRLLALLLHALGQRPVMIPPLMVELNEADLFLQ